MLFQMPPSRGGIGSGRGTVQSGSTSDISGCGGGQFGEAT